MFTTVLVRLNYLSGKKYFKFTAMHLVYSQMELVFQIVDSVFKDFCFLFPYRVNLVNQANQGKTQG